MAAGAAHLAPPPSPRYGRVDRISAPSDLRDVYATFPEECSIPVYTKTAEQRCTSRAKDTTLDIEVGLDCWATRDVLNTTEPCYGDDFLKRKHTIGHRESGGQF